MSKLKYTVRSSLVKSLVGKFDLTDWDVISGLLNKIYGFFNSIPIISWITSLFVEARIPLVTVGVGEELSVGHGVLTENQRALAGYLEVNVEDTTRSQLVQLFVALTKPGRAEVSEVYYLGDDGLEYEVEGRLVGDVVQVFVLNRGNESLTARAVLI